jgi:hypothetical protein
MDNIYLVTVATHNEGYYNALKKSAEINDYDLETLGFGQKWEGFVMKYKLYKEKLRMIDDNAIVIMVDAYDVIVMENKDILLQKFKEFNKPIVLSRDGEPKSYFFKFFHHKVFESCNNIQLNSGLMIGYAWALKELFSLMCGSNLEKCNRLDLDDQVLLINMCRNNKNFFNQNIAIDVNSTIFYNTFGHTVDFNFDVLDLFYINNNKLYLHYTDISPCFIQGPGNTNLNNLCNFYNLPLGKKTSRDTVYRLKTYTKPQYLKKFSDEIIKIKLIILILLIVLVGLYVKDIYIHKK